MYLFLYADFAKQPEGRNAGLRYIYYLCLTIFSGLWPRSKGCSQIGTIL